MGYWCLSQRKIQEVKVLEISSTQKPHKNFPEPHLAISGMDPGVTSEHPKRKPLTEWSKTLNTCRYMADKLRTKPCNGAHLVQPGSPRSTQGSGT